MNVKELRALHLLAKVRLVLFLSKEANTSSLAVVAYKSILSKLED